MPSPLALDPTRRLTYSHLSPGPGLGAVGRAIAGPGTGRRKVEYVSEKLDVDELASRAAAVFAQYENKLLPGAVFRMFEAAGVAFRVPPGLLIVPFINSVCAVINGLEFCAVVCYAQTLTPAP